MKHKKQNEKMVFDQQPQGIQNALMVNVQITNCANSTHWILMQQLPFYAERPGSNGGISKIRGHHIGKAPPGAARGHPPANKAEPHNSPQALLRSASPLHTGSEEQSPESGLRGEASNPDLQYT